MKVYREYGQKPTAVGFSAIALIELTRAPDPQSALEEATARKEAGEEVTAKAAREIAELTGKEHKNVLRDINSFR